MQLTVKEVAGWLKVTPHTIRQYIKRGHLEGFMLGRQLLIDKEAVEAFIAKCKKEGK